MNDPAVCDDCGSLNIKYLQSDWLTMLQTGLTENWQQFKWKDSWTANIYNQLQGDIDEDIAMQTVRALVGHNTRYKNYGMVFVNWYLKDAVRPSQRSRNGTRPQRYPKEVNRY